MHAIAVVRGDGDAVHGRQFLQMPLGAGIEADALVTAGAEQVHHCESYRSLGDEAAGELGEAGGAVVRIQGVVVDSGGPALRRVVASRVTHQKPVPGGRHDV
ncbi:hypothetical protein ABZ532_21680 [Streptomyces sp. NPDC019396]|uniref:hypothetical protein n=1 Tax=Streptomyces sp. NPDC019396 TaxID=3154687 RepID=UPI0033E524F9